MKKAIISIIILLLFAGVVFYFGWVQFAVPMGNCGVLISKTSGIRQEPIISGQFAWCWERLIPTNTELRIFSLEGVSIKDTISATLPSGGTYSSFLSGNPDFSYSVTMETSARIKPESLVKLVEKEDLKNQEDLDRAIKAQIKQFNACAVEFILQNAQKTSSETLTLKPLSTEDLITGTSGKPGFEDIEILFAEASNVKIPDMTLYAFAKNLYMENTEIKETESFNGIETKDVTSNVTKLDALSQLGELLTKYPVLVEYLNSNIENLEQALSVIE